MVQKALVKGKDGAKHSHMVIGDEACQRPVDPKAFTGRGRVAVRQVETALRESESEMLRLVLLVRTVSLGATLVLHKRASGARSLRWRLASSGRHVLWDDVRRMLDDRKVGTQVQVWCSRANAAAETLNARHRKELAQLRQQKPPPLTKVHIFPKSIFA